MKNRILLIGAKGYVGARLAMDLENDFTVVTCDTHGGDYAHDYMQLDEAHLQEFSEILFFAGVSNVADAVADPARAVAENVRCPLALLEKMRPHQRLTYASTGSLLSGRDHAFSLTANEMRENAYDATKLAFDLAAPSMGKRVAALRMGTVSGWSPKMRAHLIFNSMNISAIEDGVVRVSNPTAMRSILFHEDLAAFIRKLLANRDLSGIYPLASYTMSIGHLAHEIAAVYGARIERSQDTGTYSFAIPTLPTEATILQRCQAFKHDYQSHS